MFSAYPSNIFIGASVKSENPPIKTFAHSCSRLMLHLVTGESMFSAKKLNKIKTLLTICDYTKKGLSSAAVVSFTTTSTPYQQPGAGL